MSLEIKHRGTNNSLYFLAATAFTKTNPAEIAGVKAPRGVLAGSIAALTGAKDYEVDAADGTKTAVGFFVNNAEGAPFENSPAEASGKVAVCQKQASIEVDLYEDVQWALGDKVYSSANGFATNVESTNKQVLGVCTKVPTAASPNLGIDMYI